MELALVAILLSFSCGVIFLLFCTICYAIFRKTMIPKICKEITLFSKEDTYIKMHSHFSELGGVQKDSVSDFEKKQLTTDMVKLFLKHSTFEKSTTLYWYQNFYRCIRILFSGTVLFFVFFPIASLIILPIVSKII